jgi:3-oxoacyl-[acyl-carrier-protein] synthase II
MSSPLGSAHGRIVVTGAGVISSIGAGMPDFTTALWAGRSGVERSERLGGALAGDIGEFNPAPWLGNKGVRILDRATRLLCIASQMALAETRLLQDPAGAGDPELGMFSGTLFAGIHSITGFDWVGQTDGPSLVSPMEFPNTVINAPAGQAAIKHRLRGVNSTICCGLSSALYAIDNAAWFLRFGRGKYLLAGGTEEVCDESSLGFQNMGLNSAAGCVQPFGVTRDGTAPGEGSAMWMLETEDNAKARGMTPLYEICGFGGAHDGEDLTYNVRAEGAMASIRQALETAGITADAIGCIIASANGSRAGDEMEARALRTVFNGRLNSIPVCAPKAALGETMGAGGAIGALIAGLALDRQEVPPTAGFLQTDTGLSLSASAQKFSGEYALINAFSCDGNNAALVIRKWVN